MKTFSTENMPALPGSSIVAAETLKEIGANTMAFAIHEGDVIAFDVVDESGKPVVYSRAIRNNDPNSPKAYYVAVTRNGRESWITISGLTRRNFDNAYTCPLCEELSKSASFLEMFETQLKDKSIKCTSIEKQNFPQFNNGVRLETPVERNTPILAWA